MLKYNRNYNLRVMISVLRIKPTSNQEGGGSIEILKLLLSNSDALLISIFGAFIYDKLKITHTGNKSDSNKK
ncbi:hypothetical protein [Romboutsia sp.]|uniref:hypothetical protein n=1 Tax=Romboutsia sp. TaxID=1965302 RepID=UPI003F66133B